MTNHEKFRFFTSALESPDSFIDLAWWWAVSTALERRVHYGDLSRPQFCNMYVLFVGPPAVGKGTAMREAANLLHAFPYRDAKGNVRINPVTATPELLFKQLPDALTFEKLVEVLAKLPPKEYITGPNSATHYTASHFLLEELSSLLKRNKTEDVARFLLTLYDGQPFEYATKHHGTYVIRNSSLAFIAGTQVDFIRKAEQDGLLGEGLFSRFIICYERQPRQRVFDYPALTDEQKAYKKELQVWLHGLSKIKGQVTVSAETSEWLQKWYEEEAVHLASYNESKLANYFSRRKDQVKRLAAAMNFSESVDLMIPLHCFESSIAVLRRFESSVIRLANQTGRNQLYPVAERLISDIKLAGQAGRSLASVMGFLLPEMDFPEAENLIKQLQQAGRIKFDGSKFTA